MRRGMPVWSKGNAKSTSNRTKLPETATLPEPSTLALVTITSTRVKRSNIQTDNMQLTMHYNALRILSQSISSLLSPTPGSKNTEQQLLPTEPPVHLHPAQHGRPKTL